MNFNEILGDHGPELLTKLEGVGFTADQAKQFLPEAGKGIVDAVSGGNIMDLLGGGGSAISSVMEKIDIAGLASKVGVDTSMVTSGLQAILPQLLELIKGGGSGLLGAASKIGSLFGR